MEPNMSYITPERKGRLTMANYVYFPILGLSLQVEVYARGMNIWGGLG